MSGHVLMMEIHEFGLGTWHIDYPIEVLRRGRDKWKVKLLQRTPMPIDLSRKQRRIGLKDHEVMEVGSVVSVPVGAVARPIKKGCLRAREKD